MVYEYGIRLKETKSHWMANRQAWRAIGGSVYKLFWLKAALGMIENIDENIGNVISMLKNKGVYENTIIIFLSDNGPNGNRWNNELKDRKGSTNEGGVRVPFFIQWPKKIKKGLKINQVSSVLDIFPTLIDLTDNEKIKR